MYLCVSVCVQPAAKNVRAGISTYLSVSHTRYLYMHVHNAISDIVQSTQRRRLYVRVSVCVCERECVRVYFFSRGCVFVIVFVRAWSSEG